MEFKCTFATENEDYTCEISRASINRPNVNVIGFKGIQRQGKTNNSVTKVRFSASKFQHFPRHLQLIFPNLETLRLQHCDLREISRRDLVGLDKLVRLDLDNNQLKSLPDDLFSNMPNLKYVFLDCNKIEFMSSKLIEPIIANQLEWFYLRNNTKIHAFFDSIKNKGCRTIQELMAKIDEKCTPPTPPAPRIPPTTPTPQPQPMLPTPPTLQILIPTTARRESNCCTSQDILKLLNEQRRLGQFTDVVVKVGSRKFPAHKSFLAAQSSVLADVMTKSNGSVDLEISNKSAEAVESFLDYIYEQKRPGTQNAVEVIKLAAKFKVTKLIAICEEIIPATTDGSNAHEIFKVASKVKSEKLKVAAFRKLQESFGTNFDDNLMNNPELLQRIIDARKQLDDLICPWVAQANAKKPRLN